MRTAVNTREAILIARYKLWISWYLCIPSAHSSLLRSMITRKKKGKYRHELADLAELYLFFLRYCRHTTAQESRIGMVHRSRRMVLVLMFVRLRSHQDS
jgi:hypothetical protein